ncbi:MAG: hypothetical protein BroJett006_26760 [Betaproteobacteria bacterium]|nr:MAG: hypothetical protein BroJett006_26760 [Betaproteobacteria bacterium]
MSTATSWQQEARRKFFNFKAEAEAHRAKYSAVREMLATNDAALRKQREYLAELESSRDFAVGDELTTRNAEAARRKIAELEATGADLRRQMADAEAAASPAARLRHEASRILLDLGIINPSEA